MVNCSQILFEGHDLWSHLFISFVIPCNLSAGFVWNGR